MSDYLVPAEEAKGAIDLQEKLLREPVGAMETEEVMVAWSILDHIEKICSKRKTLFRERLLVEAEENGEEDDKGTRRLAMLEGKVTRQKRSALKLPVAAVMHLLKDNGIEYDEGGNWDFKPDSDKLAGLVAADRLSAEQIADISEEKVSFALLVDKPAVVKQMIEGGQDGKLGFIQSRVLPEK